MAKKAEPTDMGGPGSSSVPRAKAGGDSRETPGNAGTQLHGSTADPSAPDSPVAASSIVLNDAASLSQCNDRIELVWVVGYSLAFCVQTSVEVTTLPSRITPPRRNCDRMPSASTSPVARATK